METNAKPLRHKHFCFQAAFWTLVDTRKLPNGNPGAFLFPLASKNRQWKQKCLRHNNLRVVSTFPYGRRWGGNFYGVPYPMDSAADSRRNRCGVLSTNGGSGPRRPDGRPGGSRPCPRSGTQRGRRPEWPPGRQPRPGRPGGGFAPQRFRPERPPGGDDNDYPPPPPPWQTDKVRQWIAATERCPRCGCRLWDSYGIHNGQSIRAECRGCRFVCFPVWYGRWIGDN
ncbi:MAG: hypothetical protein KatS3mg110_4100 [Pirellulaceae bacterium]|nr:MAG: hypothetical protein KatS3mg110_4100 [Pirellulaceae bacterium]